MRSRTIRYTASEIGRLRVIEDFLPPPGDLVPREDNVKVPSPCRAAASTSSSAKLESAACPISA